MAPPADDDFSPACLFALPRAWDKSQRRQHQVFHKIFRLNDPARLVGTIGLLFWVALVSNGPERCPRGTRRAVGAAANEKKKGRPKP